MSDDAVANLRNEVGSSSIVITNSGEVEGGNVGIFAAYDTVGIGTTQTNTSNVTNPDFSPTNWENDTITIRNSGSVFAGPNSGSVFGGNFGIGAMEP